MSYKAYIWGMRVLVLLSLVAFIAVLLYIDPEASLIIAPSLFYLSLFLFLVGFFNLFLLFIRKKIIGIEAARLSIGLSFRQGVLLSILAILLLLLQSFQMLVWWDGLLAVAGVFLIELYFLSGE